MPLNKKKLRSLLAKLSPKDEAKLLAENLSEDIKAVEKKIPVQKDYSQSIKDIQDNLDYLRKKLDNLPDKFSLEEIKKKYLENINSLEKKLYLELEKITSDIKDRYKNKELRKLIEDSEKALKNLRIELLSRINEKGGGNMNRQIKVDGADVLTKYTDIDLIAGTNIVLTSTENITNKNVEIEIVAQNDATAVWGSITGTLSDQTDLQTALDDKASLALDNLASVAINTSLISDTDSTDDLGSTTIQWANVHTNRLVSTLSDLTIENDLLDGNIIFKVNDGGVDTTVMTIDGATGFVGIGMTPTHKLDVSGQIFSTKSGGGSSAGLVVSGVGGALAINRSNAAANAGWYDFIAQPDALDFRLVNDANTNATRWLTVTRSGQTPTAVIINEDSTSADFRVESNNQTHMLFVDGGNDRVGISVTVPAAKFHIDQSSTTGAIPVLTLDQADIDEDFFKFIGTSDTSVDRALVDAADFTTPGAIVGWLKINIQDDQATNPIADGDYYIPFYAAPTA